MTTRRAFLGALGLPAIAPVVGLRPDSLRVLDVLPDVSGSPADLAANEDFWTAVGEAFAIDRSLVNFNNGGVSPSPRVVQDALRRHVEYANEAPAHHLWRVQEPQRETVRKRLARFMRVDPEEVAITRNASEGLQICQFGIDLERGDEVLCTDQDYPRMRNTFEQRAAREGIVFRTFKIPTPCEDPARIVELYRANLTDRTRLLLVSHVINLTGQILPVKAVTALGREHGIPVIVDGAHAFANVDFAFDELEVDYYATSLHKWLFAPVGTGMLFVRRSRIGGLWPLMAGNPGQESNIRKFEEIGTHPIAPFLAIAEALTFHQRLEPARKAARLVYLRDRWAKRLAGHDRVRLHTSLREGMACGIACVQIEGVDSAALAEHLLRRHGFITTMIEHDDFEGLRVSPSVYSTVQEIDRFADVMEDVIREGLPA